MSLTWCVFLTGSQAGTPGHFQSVYQRESGCVSDFTLLPSFLPALGGHFYTDCRRIKLVGWAEVGAVAALRCTVSLALK